MAGCDSLEEGQSLRLAQFFGGGSEKMAVNEVRRFRASNYDHLIFDLVLVACGRIFLCTRSSFRLYGRPLMILSE